MFCIVSLSFAKFHCARICFWNPQREQATKRTSEKESGGQRGGKRSKLALVKLQRVVISVAFYLCFVCCCCFCCLSAVCVGACVRVPVCVEPTLSDSERSTTTTNKWHSAAISCAVVVVAVGDRDCLIMMAQYTHTHIYTCVYVCTACVFLINRRKYKKLN